MTEAIYNNKKSLDVLHKLIQNRFYKGYIKDDCFELTYRGSSINYPIKGILHKSYKRFYLKASLSYLPNNILIFLIILFGIFSIILFANGNWFMSLFLFVLTIGYWLQSRVFERKSMDMFIDRFSQFYNT